ncbi:single-stranded DNA-binding protein [Gilliamella sp. B3482]|uniref:single-stranded DNA-binding protein n=1 Tax=Gilliamella sp. B3482 TaxID=2817991 RepID=UPI00226AABEE|nr:single-stranded DNA-binding protein [Gilliamella sp. B3482]MCX8581984.1 single-stranded DNA-binding protein [Gilliamella sp. B3482]
MAINSINVSGNVGKDCELRVTQNGKYIASFSIAVTQGYGEHEKTSWLTCRIFGKTAEGLQPYIKKGDLITVSGEYVTEEWEKDGVKRLSPTIIVNQVQLQRKGNNQQQQRPNPVKQPTQTQSEDFIEDDIPF